MELRKIKDNDLKACLVDTFIDSVRNAFPGIKNKKIFDLSESDMISLACITIGFFELTEEYGNSD